MSIFLKPSARLLASAAIALVVMAGSTLGPNRSNTAFAACTGPSITSINHTFGPTAGGLVVNLTGSCFTGLISVHFGTSLASWALISDTSINANSPAHAAGTVDITVTTNLGTSATSASDKFEYIAPGSPCTSAAVSPASGTFPSGTQLMFTASSQGCLGPRYAFWIQSPDGTWHFKQDFPSSTYTWDTTELNGVYNIHVWVNTQGSGHDAIGSGTVTITPCSAGMLSPASTSQQAGSTISFTASASGCVNTRFAYWVQYPDMSWHFARDFGPAAFNWSTAGLAPGTYTVHAWANTGGTGFDTFGSSTVTLTGCATASISPPTVTHTTPTTITFTASATGCTSPRFSWWIQYTSFDGSWHFLQDFPSNTLVLNTTGLGPGTYTIHAWANVTGTGHDAVGSATMILT